MKFEFEYECDRDWDDMKGGDRRRYCDSCDKHVHHISGMTEKQAKAFLERHDYEVCVDFYRDEKGHTTFSERERKLERQSDGLKQLVASALAIVPLAIGAAFIDFEQVAAPQPVVATEAPTSVPEPISLGGTTPVVVTPTVNPDIPDWRPPAPPSVDDITPEPVVPVIEDEPDPDPEPAILPPRPHVRGRIARPADWTL